MIRKVAIIQARMNASRLPGKVLLDIGGKPMLAHVLERTRMAKLVDEVGVATTIDPSDDSIETFCQNFDYRCYRGSMQDVLDRYYHAARQLEADVVLRITGDCPLIDPGLIDQTTSAFLEKGVDFAANRLPPPFRRTFPIGLDVEVVRFESLAQAWRESKLPYEREHVLPYLYDSPGRFQTFILQHTTDLGNRRWTVDTPQDLELIRTIFSRFKPRTDFTWLEVLELLDHEPQLEELNAGIKHKTFLDVDERHHKKTVGKKS